MSTASVLHLRAAAPQIEAPQITDIISATSPDAGCLTTQLLDPAAPLTGVTGGSNVLTLPGTNTATKHYIIGRWITRALPAQTIGSGNWVIDAMLRDITTAGSDTITAWGACLAQWRTGTGVVSRLFDSPTGGASQGAISSGDLVVSTTINAAGSTTLTANDVLVLELWFTSASGATSALRTYTALYGGAAQYTAGSSYGGNTIPSFDATLVAPSAITFS